MFKAASLSGARLQRLPRYSLRAALFMIAFLAAAAALWRGTCDRLQVERDAAARVESLGLGVVWRPMWPDWLWVHLPCASGLSYRHADRVSLAKTSFAHSDEVQRPGDDALEAIAQLRHLTVLAIPYHAGNAGPEATIRISDNGLRHLTTLKCLTTLDLAGQPITDASLAHLESLPRLARLNLEGTAITAGALNKLVRARPKLQIAGP